jgi:hypothetical protein
LRADRCVQEIVQSNGHPSCVGLSIQDGDAACSWGNDFLPCFCLLSSSVVGCDVAAMAGP